MSDRHEALTALDAFVAKALRLSEVARMAKIERRLRDLYNDKWNSRSKRAIARAASLAARGARPGAIAASVRRIMLPWRKDVHKASTRAIAEVYKLARIAGHKKAIKATRASLAFDTPNFTAEVQKAKAKVKVEIGFGDAVDVAAVDALAGQHLFWIGGHYDAAVAGSIREVTRATMIEAGQNRTVAGRLMRDRVARELKHVRLPSGFNGSQRQYFEGLVANTMTTARVHGQMRSFGQIGVTTYEIVNPVDSRTCPVCSHMNGMVFRTSDGIDQTGKEIAAKDPAEMKTAHPWIRVTELKRLSPRGGTGGSTAKLASRGFNLPPFHFRCRCTVDISDEAGSFENLSPLDIAV